MRRQTRQPIRYAIYTRQSVEKLGDFSSCQAQFHTCKDFAEATGEPNLHWCGQRFDDEGQSGATLDRSGMRRLRKVIDLGGIDRVYAVALDRLTRNMRDAVVLLDEFDKADVDLRLVHQPELDLGAQGRFLRHVLAAFAEFERDMIASRIAESRAYLKQHGRRLAGKVPYGYDADPQTKQLVPNTVEAPRVAAIFQRAAEGQLPKQIANDINELGWPTKVYRSKRSGKTTGGGRWTARQIIATLRNPVHVGCFTDGDATRQGCHEPIVDEETFDAVQRQIDSRRTATRRERMRHDHLPLRQKIVCPRCGRFLTTYQITKGTSGGSGIIQFFYSCRSTAGGRPRCKGVHYPAWGVEQGVREMLDEPETWRKLLGRDAADETVNRVMATWRIMLWTWQNDWLKAAIQRIEIDEDEGEIKVTFAPDAAKPFLAEDASSDAPPVNR